MNEAIDVYLDTLEPEDEIAAYLPTDEQHQLIGGHESWVNAGSPHPEYHLHEAVRTGYWGRGKGRVIGIAWTGVFWNYAVKLTSGVVVIEPEPYLKHAPDLDATLPVCEDSLQLTAGVVNGALDGDGNWWKGVL